MGHTGLAARERAVEHTEADRTIDDLVRTLLGEGIFAYDIRKDARPLVASLIDGAVGAPRRPEQSVRVK